MKKRNYKITETESGSFISWVSDGMGPDNKRKKAKITGATPEEVIRKAERWFKDIEEEKKCPYTVKTAMTHYVDGLSTVIEPTTVRCYREIIRNKFQFIMDIKLEELKPRDIQAAINIDAQRLGYKSIKNAYGLLLAVMRANDISINLRSIRLPKKEITTRKLPTADEVYSVVKGTSSELPVLLAMWLSLRIGEVAGLQFQDVDEKNMSIYVRREIVRTDEGWTLVDHCKTVTSTRYVNLPEHILRLIKALPHEKDTDFLFTVNPNTIRKRFKKLLKANNMDIRFHDLRHIFASTTAMLNIPEKYAMEMGGWSTPDVYKNVYQETFDSERIKADVAVDTYFNSIISNENK